MIFDEIQLNPLKNQTITYTASGNIYELSFIFYLADLCLNIKKNNNTWYNGRRVVLNSLILPLSEPNNFLLFSNIDNKLLYNNFGKTQKLYYLKEINKVNLEELDFIETIKTK